MARCADPDHRSYSADRLWDTCQFHAHAVAEGMVAEVRPSDELAVGSAVDLVVKSFYAGDPVSPLAATEHFWSVYDLDGNRLDAAVERVDRLVALWEREVRPAWDAVGVDGVDVEMHWQVHGVTYHAHLDVLLADGTVIDLKTSKRRLDQTGAGRADTDLQLTIYADAVWRTTSHLPPAVVLDGLIDANPPVDVKAWRPDAGRPWWDRQVARRTEDQLLAWEETVRRREFARRMARASGLYQLQGISHQYACRDCPARSICPAWQWEGGSA